MAVAQPVGFDSYNHAVTGDVSKTLDVGQDYHHVPNVFQPIPLDLRNAGRDPEKHDEMNRQGVGVGDPGDPAHTVTSAFVHGVAQPVSVVAPTITAANNPSRSPQSSEVTQQVWAVMQATTYSTPEIGSLIEDNVSSCITKNTGAGGETQNPAFVQTAMQVRRLTPVECERLQGFPDGYTEIPWRKKPASECPDGPRYKALGNSWAVPVVRWIGKRIETEIKCKPNK
jgi:site-specific DNA-cytosine methylase